MDNYWNAEVFRGGISLQEYKVGVVSLGCSKNLVDAERMLFNINQRGFTLSPDPALADIVIINTCGFIQAAKEEAIEVILEFAQLKAEGRVKKIIVTGCLTERYREEAAELFPEVDGFVSIGCNAEIADIIETLIDGTDTVTRFGCNSGLPLTGERIIATLPFFSYLKIAEGCDNCCSYCAIPSIRGGYRSVPFGDVLAEAQFLAENGVTEINIIAQDTTLYGYDLYKKYRLPELLREICKIDGFKWVRVLYCYPEKITDELLQVIADEPKIVKYLDIPIQHCCGDILTAMNRKGDESWLRAFFANIREKIPEITLRTTLITGFPGETDEQLETLLNFVKDMKFDRLGCFSYSPEEGTPAADFDGQIERETAELRAEQIMEAQQRIMEEKNEKMLGKAVTAVTEGFDKYAECYFGRTASDAPDIDGKIFFTVNSGKKLIQGQYVEVSVTETLDYDLIGEVLV